MFQRKKTANKTGGKEAERQPAGPPPRRVVSDIAPASGRVARPVLRQPARPTAEHSPEQEPERHVHVEQVLEQQVSLKNESPDFLSPKPQEPLTREIAESHHGGSRRPMRAVGIGLGIIGAVVAYIFWTAELTIAIKPKKVSFELPKEGLTITVDAKEFSSSLAKRGEGTSLEAKAFSERAKGTIVVFNAFGSAPQTLVNQTRFESPDGKIYRLNQTITVPGMKDGKPGSVEAVVVADQAGESYNIDLTDFTIPGFKGSPKFEGFYGRSKTPMTGGAAGQGKVVGKKEADELLSRLEGEMVLELKKNFEASISDAFIAFPEKNEYRTVSRVTDPPIGAPAEQFFGEVRGEAKTLGVEKRSYIAALGKALMKDSFQDGAYVLDKSSAVSASNITLDYQGKKVKMTLTGSVIFVGEVPVDEIREKALSAKDSEALKGIFTAYPGIQKAEAVFTPSFWKRIPGSANRLHIEVE